MKSETDHYSGVDVGKKWPPIATGPLFLQKRLQKSSEMVRGNEIFSPVYNKLVKG